MFSRLVADWLGLETKSACSVFGLVARASFSSLERGPSFWFVARASLSWLERGLRPVLDLNAVFVGSSELSSLERAVLLLARASFSSLERGFLVSGRSSDQVFARASLSYFSRQQRGKISFFSFFLS